jgi:hypothetical protein
VILTMEVLATANASQFGLVGLPLLAAGVGSVSGPDTVTGSTMHSPNLPIVIEQPETSAPISDFPSLTASNSSLAWL